MSDADDNLNLYNEYNKTLRAWLVGFGFGVPALFILNQEAQDKLLDDPNVKLIVWLFLAGATFQIAIAFLNKIISWCAYRKHKSGGASKIVVIFAGLEDWFLLDVLFDFLSLIAFGWSIFLIVALFTNT